MPFFSYYDVTVAAVVAFLVDQENSLYICNVRFIVLQQFCEEFKESSSLCVPCGLRLADKAQPAVVRHFGLQILEHVIK